jgi:hypothetical protein
LFFRVSVVVETLDVGSKPVKAQGQQGLFIKGTAAMGGGSKQGDQNPAASGMAHQEHNVLVLQRDAKEIL